MAIDEQSRNSWKIKKIWDDYITKRIVDEEVQKVNIDSYLASVICPGPFYYYVIDFSDRSLPFVSTELFNVLGLAPAEYSVDKFFEILHPDDAPFMAACEEKICDFLYNKISPQQMLSYKFSYQFRLRSANGDYIHILHQAIALSVDDEGQLHQVLGIHTDIGHITTSTERRLSFIGLNGEPSYYGIDLLGKGYLCKPEEHSYSVQEKKIIGLMAEGLTTSTLADTLNISKETVATHRKNILKKSRCKNMVEVIAKALKEGII